MSMRRLSRRVVLVAGVAASLPTGAGRGKEAGRIYRLGMLFGVARKDNPLATAFLEVLSQAGFVEGVNLDADRRGIGILSGAEQLQLVKEWVASGIDVIATAGSSAKMVQETTRAVPIVTINDDMVAEGLVRSFARPDGNLTGISILAPELNGKRQELLLEAAPGVRVMAALADPRSTSPAALRALQEAAHARGVALQIYQAGKNEEVVPAIDEAHAAGAQGLNLLATPLVTYNRAAIVERTLRLKFPAIYQWPEDAEAGGLMAYGPRIIESTRQQARLVVKILDGAKPADLPIEQPVPFELALNLNTAKAIAFQFPAGLTDRADRIIE
jgi:putative ABC transport system substrate-binding protein